MRRLRKFSRSQRRGAKVLTRSGSRRGFKKKAVFEEHNHELNPNYDTPTNFHFTQEQKQIIEKGIDSHSTNLFILENIKQRNSHTYKAPDVLISQAQVHQAQDEGYQEAGCHAPQEDVDNIQNVQKLMTSEADFTIVYELQGDGGRARQVLGLPQGSVGPGVLCFQLGEGAHPF